METTNPDRHVLFITHAEVVIDPAVPVPDWPLSDAGRARHVAFSRGSAARRIGSVYSSGERTARDGAEILAAARGLTAVVVAALRENDRSATGYLPRPAFEAMADRFFARPLERISG